MFEGCGEERIRFRLQSLSDRQRHDLPRGVLRQDILRNEFEAYLRSLTLILDQSPTGRCLLRTATVQDISVGLDPLLEPQSGFYYPQQNHLDLGYQPASLQRTEKGISRYLSAFAAGLRRVWHYYRDATPDLSLLPQDFIRYCRAEEADVEAVTHMIAWELRGAGPGFFWRHMVAEANGDIALAFARTAGAHPRHQFDGTALRAAFLQWFSVAERVDACDHLALERMDMALLDKYTAGQIGRYKLDRDRLSILGYLPTGQNYLSGMRFRSPALRRPCDPFNRTHLKHLQRDISYLIENQKSI